MYMRGSNNQPDMVQEKLGTLQAEIAELKTEVKHIHRQSESRDRWLQGIGIAVIAAALVWFGQNAVDSHSAHKANSGSVSNSKGK